MRYVRLESKDDYSRISGTKYITATKSIDGVSYCKKIAEDLQSGKTVLFFGIGCDVGTVFNYIRKQGINADNLYLVDIICHGPLPTIVLEKYINELEKNINRL